MGVPAITTQYGKHHHWVDRLRPFTGTQGDGSPINWTYPEQRYLGFSSREWPNKEQVFLPGTKIRAPKRYLRVLARVHIDKPYVVREAGYSDAWSRNIGYFLSGNAEPQLPPGAGGILENLKAKSAVQALNKLKKGKMEAGVDLAESRKTLQMIAKPTIQVVQALLAARRGRWGDIPRHLGVDKRSLKTGSTAASKWLEYQYGWLPLMGSIHDGMELLKEGFRREQQIFSVRSTAVEKYEHTVPYDSLNDRVLSGEFRWKTGIIFSVANATDDLIDRAGLGNPFSIAWELVPFSFVADWFIPVGNVLSSLTATSGLEFKGAYTSEVRQTQERVSFNSYPQDPHKTLQSEGEFLSEGFSFARNPLSSFPRPQFYANTHPFSTGRVLNAIALIRQLFR